jgi:hypothetical protein
VLHPGRATVSKVAIAPAAARQRRSGGPGARAGCSDPPSVPQAEIREKLASMYDAKDPACVFVFGFRTQVTRAARPRAAPPSRAAGAPRRRRRRPPRPGAAPGRWEAL